MTQTGHYRTHGYICLTYFELKMARFTDNKKRKPTSYHEARPDIVKIFDDLESLHDFCRFNLLPFNPADLYNYRSRLWHWYQNRDKPRKPRPRRHHQK